ncbi:MAG: potassium transporter [Xanthomonadales bacterium]|nr:monovalent cation:proton antiporter-2 (CPA2) family protein [Gammaproteobacteria bacterium]MBT8054309.1 monovalent cation:proton antiporter-2 (CPA2) family protein [Gammaproteobacteria bacterium]NND57498.1 potassium transporter [Xanthomonadales bacterium]NNK51222.1 potassium transporter [Xanthomonadales bacterium]
MYSELFSQALVYLLAAVLAVPLAKRLGLGSALGYLLAGVVIGPFVLGLIGPEGQDVMHFAEFGVVLMLFLVGLELEPEVLWRMRVPILGLGGSQVIISASVIGGAAWYFGLPWQTATAIGLILALSSTAIVLQTLNEKSWTGTRAGRAGFAVLLFQDIAVIPILALLPFLALEGAVSTTAVDAAHGAQAGLAGWLRGLVVLGVVLAIVISGRFLMRPVFHWIASTRSLELFIATALTLIVGITLAMEYVGLSPALGTFLAGVVLAESEFKHELESNIEPFKGLLLGLFFISVGASLDFGIVVGQPALVLMLMAALILSKFFVLLMLGKLFKLNLADNLMFAFLLAQGGEFAFLLFSFATQNRVVSSEISNLLNVVVVLTMMLTPLLIIAYEKWVRPRFTDCVSPPEDDEIAAEPNPVIVAGYGRFGQIVSRMLSADGIQTTLLDHDSSQIELTARFGNKVFYGDASRLQLLQAAGAEEAKLLVIAIDERDKAVQMVTAAKKFFPHLQILARAYDRSHNYRLMEAGADVITRETFGSALIMGEEALKLLGYDDARAYRLMRSFKKHDEEGLSKLYEVWGDDHAYGLQVRQSIEQLEKVLKDDSEESVEDFRQAWQQMRGAEKRRFPEG